ncbi:hypothetical protein PsorP6_015285 [Peronosclerospora sorghi]|uniref:Uncharacterized protein n=1 Tax=Peronosclerospora sorghi TaxID=230839 RepID=A0ACC0VSN0_9STRA|nr:hypothetical protein PsorP6_015285 [Peronosclerospora sorghi]
MVIPAKQSALAAVSKSRRVVREKRKVVTSSESSLATKHVSLSIGIARIFSYQRFKSYQEVFAVTPDLARRRLFKFALCVRIRDSPHDACTIELIKVPANDCAHSSSHAVLRRVQKAHDCSFSALGRCSVDILRADSPCQSKSASVQKFKRNGTPRIGHNGIATMETSSTFTAPSFLMITCEKKKAGNSDMVSHMMAIPTIWAFLPERLNRFRARKLERTPYIKPMKNTTSSSMIKSFFSKMRRIFSPTPA